MKVEWPPCASTTTAEKNVAGHRLFPSKPAIQLKRANAEAKGQLVRATHCLGSAMESTAPLSQGPHQGLNGGRYIICRDGEQVPRLAPIDELKPGTAAFEHSAFEFER